MIQRPVFKPKYHLETVPDVGTFLLSENERHVLEGDAMRVVVPLIDGRRTWPEIVAAAAPAVGDEQARLAMGVLLEQGHVVEQDDYMPPQFAAYWTELGRNSVQVSALLASTNIHVRTFGHADATPFVTSLRAFGFAVDQDRVATLVIALADDYQDPQLAALNRHSLAYGQPWILAKPSGLRQLIGPIFVPGRGACWQCLENRLKHNREVESYIQRKTGKIAPFPVTRTRIPMAEQQAAHALTLQIAKWLSLGVNPELESRIAAFDIFSLQPTFHYVVRRPQCPACGNPALARVGGLPLHLSSQVANGSGDNGSRLESPETTFARYAHHVSDISGIVKGIFPSEWSHQGPLRVYVAGHNFALKNDELFFLKDGLRANSSGKGRSDAQARTSALCEALERYSGLFRGEEACVAGSYRELGDAAVDPRSVMLFSETQYADRLAWLARGSRFQVVPQPFDEDARISWSPVWSHTRQCVRYLPTSSLYYGFREPNDDAFYSWADSNGNAAGGTVEDAILQGFLELVERDAVAIWWYNRLPRPELDLATLNDPYVAELQAYFDGFDREFWVLDVTSDLGIPAYAAINRRRNHPVEDIVLGFGAHLDPRIAFNRAITEMNQFIPAVLARDEQGATRYAFDDHDTLQWWKSATLANQPYLRPAGKVAMPPSPALSNDIRQQLEQCFATVEGRGMEVMILNQTRPDVGLPVVKVIVPGLRHFWARFAPGRLYDVPVAMGWLERPNDEAGLNPVPMFV